MDANRILRGVALGIAIMCIASVAGAGTRMVTETRKVGSQSAKVQRAQILVDGDKLRLDAAGGKTSVIYRSANQEIWMVDHRNKTFLKVSQETTRAVASQIETIKSEVSSRLTPEQRAAMEKLVGTNLTPEAVPEAQVEVRKLDGGDVVSGVVCHDREIWRAGKRVALACSASYAAAGLGEDSLAIMRRLSQFFEESLSAILPSEVRREGLDAFSTFDELDGVPMRVETYSSEGWPDRETVVTEIADAQLGESEFQIPDGYRPRININVREGFGGP